MRNTQSNGLKKNGFEIVGAKQYVSKTKFKLVKGGEEDSFELPNEVTNIKKYMEMYHDNFKMKLKIKELTAELKESTTE